MDTPASSTEARLENAEWLAFRNATAGQNLGVLLGNWVQYTGIFGSALTRQPTPVAQTAPSNTCVMAGVLQCQNSGIFYVSFGATWQDDTAADVVTVTLVGNQTGGPGVLTSSGGGFVAHGQAGANVAFATIGPIPSDVAGGAGLLLDGTAINTFASGVRYPSNASGAVVPTGGAGTLNAGTQGFSWSGILTAGAINKARFSVGQKVCFGMLCTSLGSHVVNFGNANLTIWEIPFG
jgi:hypothetical protein